jgi:hypothetical protein
MNVKMPKRAKNMQILSSDDLLSHMERFLDSFSTILHPNNYIMVTGTANRIK